VGSENGWQADREHFEHYADEEPKPAPAPLPEEDFMEILNDALKHAVWVPGEELRASATMLRQFADLHKKWPLAEAIRRVLRAIATQARRLAVCENRMFAIGEGVSISHDFVEAHISDLTRRLAKVEEKA